MHLQISTSIKSKSTLIITSLNSRVQTVEVTRAPITWSSLFSNISSSSSVEDGKLECFNISDVEDVVEVPTDIQDIGTELWKEYLVGFFADKRMPLPLVKKTLERVWKTKASYEISTDRDLFYFKFLDSSDRQLVLEGGPCATVPPPTEAEQEPATTMAVNSPTVPAEANAQSLVLYVPPSNSSGVVQTPVSQTGSPSSLINQPRVVIPNSSTLVVDFSLYNMSPQSNAVVTPTLHALTDVVTEMVSTLEADNIETVISGKEQEHYSCEEAFTDMNVVNNPLLISGTPIATEVTKIEMFHDHLVTETTVDPPEATPFAKANGQSPSQQSHQKNNSQ
ncbi:hypothetical protein IFM89_015320 [Coptis chinensis]|uniref:DUF4283 domain-containing protein n=1 Tax=Coptis chinensis TaxID=261450 RepID=A0A835ISN8_9MAGN|nr:hypothetical protein IFM89_015320 [Coptis chinensis]